MIDIKAPLRVNIQITMACNQTCAYCYNPYHNQSEMMSMEDFKHVADTMVKLGVFKISLAGGEPLLHPLFFDMYEYISQKENSFMPPIILTNGSIYSDTIIKKIIDLKKYGVLRIQVSLDSLTPVAGMQDKHIDKTIQFIDTLIDAGINPSIGSVVTSDNIDQIPDIVNRYKSNIEHYHLMPPKVIKHNHQYAYNKQPTKQQLQNLNKTLSNLAFHVKFENDFEKDEDSNIQVSGCNTCRGCAAGYTHCVIDPSLDVFVCEITPDIIIGNMKRESFEEIWRGSHAEKVRSQDIPLCHDLSLVEELSVSKNNFKSIPIIKETFA